MSGAAGRGPDEARRGQLSATPDVDVVAPTRFRRRRRSSWLLTLACSLACLSTYRRIANVLVFFLPTNSSLPLRSPPPPFLRYLSLFFRLSDFVFFLFPCAFPLFNFELFLFYYYYCNCNYSIILQLHRVSENNDCTCRWRWIKSNMCVLGSNNECLFN